MKKKLLVIVCVLLLIPFSTFAQGRNSKLNVLNINEIDDISGDALFYALPKNIIRVEVEFTQTITEPGEFYQYAYKYLGLGSVPESRIENWEITNIEIKQKAEIDSSRIFAVFSEGEANALQLNLTEKGLLAGINIDRKMLAEDKTQFIPDFEPEETICNYSDLAMTINYMEITKTEYQIVKTDTSVERVAVNKSQTVYKSDEEKAKEATDVILKLREQRGAFLNGIYEKFPDGEALKHLIAESKSTEERYMQLFRGVTTKYKNKYYFEFTPDSSNISTNNVLFTYSQTKGIVSRSEPNGRLVVLTMLRRKPNSPIQNYQLRQAQLRHAKKKSAAKENGIVYLKPEELIFEITSRNRVLARKVLFISQLGYEVRLPLEVCKYDGYSVEFDDITGALLQISKKESLEKK